MSRLALCMFTLGLALANLYVYAPLVAATGVRVVPLAVGKGDATLVVLPAGHAILLNTGGDASVVRALGEALPLWQHHLDAIILLSQNAAEVGGVPFVLERYKVEQVEKIPPGEGLVLHYKTLALPLSSTTPAGVYAIK